MLHRGLPIIFTQTSNFPVLLYQVHFTYFLSFSSYILRQKTEMYHRYPAAGFSSRTSSIHSGIASLRQSCNPWIFIEVSRSMNATKSNWHIQVQMDIILYHKREEQMEKVSLPGDRIMNPSKEPSESCVPERQHGIDSKFQAFKIQGSPLV